MPKKILSIKELYSKFISVFIKDAQSNNDIPSYYKFISEDGSTYIMTLPKSVMEQRRLILLMYESAEKEFDADVDQKFVSSIVANCTKDKMPIILEAMSYEELEVLKKTYTDMLLLPLSLRGAKAIEKQMSKIMKQHGFKNS